MKTLEKSIDESATRVLNKLLTRGNNAKDYVQARKFAAARRSWRQLDVPARSHSYSIAGALNRMWLRVIEMCDKVLDK